MTDDEIVTLGSFFETLIGHSAWAVIVEQFEPKLLSTHHEQKKREGIYKTNYCSRRLCAAGCGP